MRKTRKSERRRRAGFTLLEVLLVVAILALLAAAVVPQFIGTEERAKKKMAQGVVASGGTLATQLELFRHDMGRYPESLKELTDKPDSDEEQQKWAGPYITYPGSLKDPWNRELEYKCPGEHNENSYDLWSKGPKEDDDGDDIGNWRKE